jgi:hypothetical protein
MILTVHKNETSCSEQEENFGGSKVGKLRKYLWNLTEYPETSFAAQVSTICTEQHMSRSRIHECPISLRCMGIILRVIRFEVSFYYVYITNPFQTTFAHGGGGKPIVEVTVNSKEENSLSQ